MKSAGDFAGIAGLHTADFDFGATPKIIVGWIGEHRQLPHRVNASTRGSVPRYEWHESSIDRIRDSTCYLCNPKGQICQ